MSSKLALKQLSVIAGKAQQESKIHKTIKERRKARKKHQAVVQQQFEQAQTTFKQNLQYYQQTQTTQGSTAELMNKLLGQARNSRGL
jgi:siroheme synthase